jgi:hypothetical protein
MLAMNPRQFQAMFVDGNIAEFDDNAHDLRRAANAIWAIDALAAHVYEWAKENALDKVSSSIKDDTSYRAELAGRSEGFRILRDAVPKAELPETMSGFKLVRYGYLTPDNETRLAIKG